MKANLQDTQQMKAFMEEFRHEYKREAQAVEAEQEPSLSE